MTLYWDGGTLAYAVDVVCFSPIQVVPFPSKPSLQVHMKLPTILWHVALEWQLSRANSQSFLSESYVPEKVGHEINEYM